MPSDQNSPVKQRVQEKCCRSCDGEMAVVIVCVAGRNAAAVSRSHRSVGGVFVTQSRPPGRVRSARRSADARRYKHRRRC